MGYAQYSEMDGSGVAWLKDTPRHWRIKRLKFSADLINNKVSVEESSLPYLGLEHIESWTGRKIDGEITNSDGLASSFLAGDVLFGKLRPYLAKVHLAQQNGLISSEALVVRSKAELHAEFLKYYMLSRAFINIVDSSTYGSKMPRASWDFIGNLPVLLPEIDEQQAIASFLDFKTAQVDALIAKKEALLTRLAEKRTALISHAVTKGLEPSAPMKDSGVAWLGEMPEHWEIKKLSWLFYYSKGANAALLTKSYIGENLGEYPVFSGQTENEGLMGNIDWHEFDFNVPVIFVTTVGAKTMSTRLVSGKFSLSQNCALIIPRLEEIEASFFERTLQPLFEYERKSISLIMQPSLRFEDLNKFKVPLPPKDEQEAITRFLDFKIAQIDTQVEKIREAISKLVEYRSALITCAVTGKIDVRGFKASQSAEGIAS